MTKSQFRFDEIILEKRSDDPAQPASGKFSLYNKNGGAYIRDGDSGQIAMLSSTAQSFVYIGTGSIEAGINLWNIALPSGYVELELLLNLQTNTTATRNLDIRFDGVAAGASYRYQYLWNNLGTAGAITSTTANKVIVPSIVPRWNTEPVHDWTTLHIFGYEDGSKSTVVRAVGQNTNHGYGTLASGGQNTGYVGVTNTINLSPSGDAFGNCIYHLWGKKAV